MSNQTDSETIITDELDDSTVTLSFSPRELSVLLQGMIAADAYMTGVHPDYRGKTADLGCANLRRWDAIIDYVKDKALEHGA